MGGLIKSSGFRRRRTPFYPHEFPGINLDFSAPYSEAGTFTRRTAWAPLPKSSRLLKPLLPLPKGCKRAADSAMLHNNIGGGVISGNETAAFTLLAKVRVVVIHIDCLRLTDCLSLSPSLLSSPSSFPSSPRLTSAAAEAALSGGGRAGATSAPVIFAYSKCLSLFNDAERKGQV